MPRLEVHLMVNALGKVLKVSRSSFARASVQPRLRSACIKVLPSEARVKEPLLDTTVNPANELCVVVGKWANRSRTSGRASIPLSWTNTWSWSRLMRRIFSGKRWSHHHPSEEFTFIPFGIGPSLSSLPMMRQFFEVNMRLVMGRKTGIERDFSLRDIVASQNTLGQCLEPMSPLERASPWPVVLPRQCCFDLRNKCLRLIVRHAPNCFEGSGHAPPSCCSWSRSRLTSSTPTTESVPAWAD